MSKYQITEYSIGFQWPIIQKRVWYSDVPRTNERNELLIHIPNIRRFVSGLFKRNS